MDSVTPGGAARFSPLASFVTRNRGNLILRKIAGACRRYLGWYGNHSYDLLTNGEGRILDVMGRFAPPVIFDVGANVGEWSLAAHRASPGSSIYAFEISPRTFDVLTANTRDVERIRVVRSGLSDAPGIVRLRHYEDMPSLTTATEYPHPFSFTEVEAPVTTGDAYATSAGVGHIDLLKIDVEGMEEQVLRGFDGMFARGAIDVVQFEYGRVNIINHFLLRDFYEFFAARGFVVGKIFPNRVDFRPYDMSDEDFMGPNYLACRTVKPAYIEAFGGKSR